LGSVNIIVIDIDPKKRPKRGVFRGTASAFGQFQSFVSDNYR